MKISKTTQKIIDKLNQSIRDYAVRNGNLLYKPVENNDYGDWVGSINFGKFTAYFCFDELDLFGYRFLEAPISEEKTAGIGALLTRIKFDFSNLYFSLYDIHNVIKSNEFTTLDFHNLSDENEFEIAFNSVGKFITKNLYVINNIASDFNLQQEITNNYFADVKALNKKPKLDEFDTNIHDATLYFESDLYTNPKLENEIDLFLCTSKYSSLLKKFYKYEEKGKLTVFEKRFVNYLVDNDFPAIAPERKSVRKKENKNNLVTGIFSIITLIISFALTLFLIVAIEDMAISNFYGDMTYIGIASNHELPFVLILFAIMVCVARVFYLIPKIKDWTLFNSISKNITVVNVISVIAVFVIIGCSFSELLTYKNKSVVSDTTGVYLGEEKLENSDKIEFFYILGYNTYDDNGDEVYETGEGWTDYLMVLDGDYQDYYYCEGLLNEDGSENKSAVDSVKANGFEFKEYKSMEDYCSAHGFEF